MNGSRLRAMLAAAAFVSATGGFPLGIGRGRCEADDGVSGVALSLRVLQEKLPACDATSSATREILELAGMTCVWGYVVDPQNHDIILVGEQVAGRPAIHLEDLVVAMRNAWNRYVTVEDGTRYYSYPGCSIDPDPVVMRRLEELGSGMSSQSPRSSVDAMLADWDLTCRSPQSVRVFGIPSNTRFARTMVEADYDMKRIVDGSDSLPIDGFQSLTDLTLSKAREAIVRRRQASVPSGAMNRFWFSPGRTTYERNSGVALIRECRVGLLTEEEHLSGSGEIRGTGGPGRLASVFSRNFSAHYEPIADARPIYRELENLFRMVAVAKLMETRGAFAEAGLNLDYLLDEWPVPHTDVDETKAGRSNVKQFTHRIDEADGYSVTEFWLPSCGGVGIDINVSDSDFVGTKGRVPAALREDVLRERPEAGALRWNVRIPVGATVRG